MEETTESKEATERFAKRFLDRLLAKPGKPGTATVVALEGDLGAGKTTFTKGIARALSLPDLVTSPTFVIEKVYYIDPPQGPYRRLVHIDAYRLEDPKELESIGWHEIATDPENLILIEWPQKVAGLIPPRAWHIAFSYVDEHSRNMVVTEPAQ